MTREDIIKHFTTDEMVKQVTIGETETSNFVITKGYKKQVRVSDKNALFLWMFSKTGSAKAQLLGTFKVHPSMETNSKAISIVIDGLVAIAKGYKDGEIALNPITVVDTNEETMSADLV